MSRARVSIQSAVVAALLTVLLPALAAAQVRSFAFISQPPADQVTVLDTSTNTAIAGIAGITLPGGVAVTPDGQRAIVVSTTHLVFIDVATMAIAGTLPIGFASSDRLVITPDGAKAYVVRYAGSAVTVIDLVNNVWQADIVVTNAHFAAVTPDGGEVYVTHDSYVTRIDTSTDTVVGPPLDLSLPVSGIAISPDGAYAYAAVTGKVIQIDLATQAPTGTEYAVDYAPSLVAITPDGTRLVVSNQFGYVSVIDLVSGTVAPMIMLSAMAIAITPDSRWAYITTDDGVEVIDLDTATAGSPIPLPHSPWSIASNFMSPAVIAGIDALDVAQDSDLALAGFRDFVPMRAGTLRLTSDLTTTRTFSILTTSTINTGTHAAAIPHVIGGGDLVKTGTGTLRLTGNASHSSTGVAAGTLVVNGTHSPTITTSLSSQVRGTGTAGSVIIDSGGILRPGDGGPGILTMSNLQLLSSSTLTIDLAGTTVGTGYSRAAASTGATIGANVTLDVQIDALFSPAPGDQFTILTNHTSGTFDGLAEGAGFMLGAVPFRITYAGGSGHDVVLTVDAPPNVTTLSDDATDEDQVYSVPFTIGDAYTTVGDLTVSATSVNNQTLVPNVNVIVTGTGAFRTLEVTPAANASGTAQIMVDVGDGLLSTQRVFNLTVNAVDDAPTITPIAPQTIVEDTALAPVAFTVDDIDTDVAALAVTATSSVQHLVVNADLIAGGSGSTRTIGLTPQQNAFGTATITVRVSDGTSYDERQFLLTVTNVNDAPTITSMAPQTISVGNTFATSDFTVADPDEDAGGLTAAASSSNQALIPDANLTLGGSGGARTIIATPAAGALGTSTITVTVGDGDLTATATLVLTVSEKHELTYTLAEGATGSFFDTDLAIANPHAQVEPVVITFLKEDGTSVVLNRDLLATSRTTIAVDGVEGLEAALFSIEVTSTNGVQLGVERTMRWDASGYGASTEKASLGASNTWYFAEGSQGYFSTFLLLANPSETANVAHVTWLREGETPLVRDYELQPRSRKTIDAFSESDLRDRSFGAKVTFDQPGFAERSMYFGSTPIWLGGHAAAGATAPGTNWFLAEGATGSFFTTFVLIANPGGEPAEITLTYYPESGSPVTRTDVVGPGQRMTRNIALEDASLASAAVATRVTSTQPVIVERSQYWGSPSWVESHNSVGVQQAFRAWILAEGNVGGAHRAQTYILLANTGTEAATVTLTFLKTDGTTLIREVNVPAESRVTIGVTGAEDGLVPELTDETFGTLIRSTEPIIVERSIYMNSNGVVWAAGTNATATPVLH